MYPTVTIGPLEIDLYVTLRVAAIALLLTWVALRLRRSGLPVTLRTFFLNSLPWLIVGALFGGLLENALPLWVEWIVHGVPLPPGWWWGSRVLGSLGGASLLGYVYCRRRGLPVGRAFDLFAVPLPLMLGVARVGCLLKGCCYGQETSAWPALVLPDSHGVWASRYPTQLADVLANLLIFVLLVAFERVARRAKGPGWPFDGFLFLLFAELYLVQRFLFEFWRADSLLLCGPFHWPHLSCAIGIAIATWLLVRGMKSSRLRPTS